VVVKELADGADLRETIATYAELPAGFIRAYGGDRFPPAVHAIDGGAS